MPLKKKKKNTRDVSIVVKGLKAEVFFYWRGFKSHAYLSFSFPSYCDIKNNYVLSYCKPNYVQFWFYFSQIS